MIKRVRLSTVVLMAVLAVTAVLYFTLPRPSPPEERRDAQGRPLPREVVEEEPDAGDDPTTATTAPEAVPEGEEPATPDRPTAPEPDATAEDPDDAPVETTTSTTTSSTTTTTPPPPDDGGTGIGPDQTATTIPAA